MWELDCEEGWAPKNWCFWTVVLEKTLESPLDCKEIQPVHSKGDQPCSLKGTMLKLKLQDFGHLMQRVDSLEKLWCWEGLGAGGKGDDRGWDGWMASLTLWTWVWVNSGSWWWTGRPGMLQFMGSQRVRHDWTELKHWSCLAYYKWKYTKYHVKEVIIYLYDEKLSEAFYWIKMEFFSQLELRWALLKENNSNQYSSVMSSN